MLHKGKVVLVIFSFHFNQDIILPSWCPATEHPKEIYLHCLDVVLTVSVYLSAAASFMQIAFLRVLIDLDRGWGNHKKNILYNDFMG